MDRRYNSFLRQCCIEAGRIGAESAFGRLKQALGLEAGRTKVWYVVTAGRYEASYKNEEKARKKARKMLKKHPGSEILLSKTTLVEKEKRPFWRFWRIENASLHIERLALEEPSPS